MHLLKDALNEIKERVKTDSALSVFLDFDGTLTPIVRDHLDAHLNPNVRQTLTKLVRSGRIAVCVMSGRSLQDLYSRVGVEGITYAGNHGLEIFGPGLQLTDPIALSDTNQLQTLSKQLAKTIRHIAGAEVEFKQLSISVHFRKVADRELPAMRTFVTDIVAAYGGKLCVFVSKKAFEILPLTSWNKGKAVQWINERLGIPAQSSIYIGDDSSDEDAFEALAAGITIRVGDLSHTRARYLLAHTREVHEFLEWLVDPESVA